MREGEFVVGSSGAGTEFLRAELLAGITRAHIAENTSDESKTQRNRQEARKAYDSIFRFLPQTLLSQQEKEQIVSKLTELKVALRSLGGGGLILPGAMSDMEIYTTTIRGTTIPC